MERESLCDDVLNKGRWANFDPASILKNQTIII